MADAHSNQYVPGFAPALIAVTPRERELFLDVLSMPEKYRQVILLHYYQDMTLREMGLVLGLTPSTVHHR